MAFAHFPLARTLAARNRLDEAVKAVDVASFLNAVRLKR